MKIVKKIAAALGALILLAVLGIVVKFYVLSPKLRPAPEVKAPTDAESVARGKYIVNHVAGCVGCHSPVDKETPGEPPLPGQLGGGRDFGAIPGMPMHIRAPNLTPDKDTGLGNWTDGEILRAMREGVSRDGRPLFPQMPYPTYREKMDDATALDVIAYLRTLAPVSNKVGKTDVDFPISMFSRLAPAPLTSSPPPPPPPGDKLARGRWLLKVASCNDCHDAFNERHEPIPGKSLAGGFKIPMSADKYAIAPNITSDKATGIGAYSDEDLLRVFNEGKGKAGRFLYVMPWYYYKGMTDDDKRALVAALREVPPVANVVPPSKVE